MKLSKVEERMLAGDYGPAVQKALEVLVRVGEALGASRLVPIAHAHVSGVSYFNIGDEGLEFIESLSRHAKTRVFATYNPLGVPLNVDESPTPLDEDVISKQRRIVKCLHAMGFKPSATCAPYLIRPPKRGEHLAWGESSAVAVANSLYGACTNREGGPLALLAAIAGRTYYWGMHIKAWRVPSHVMLVPAPQNEVEAGLIGYLAGKLAERVVRVYVAFSREAMGNGIPFSSAVHLCAAAGAWGNIALVDLRLISGGEAKAVGEAEVVRFERQDLRSALDEVSTADLDEAEVFYAGCPHLPPEEALRIIEYILVKGIKFQRELWLSLPGYLLYEDHGFWSGLARRLLDRGVRILFGTCAVVSRILGGVKVLATNSLKAAFYLPRLHGVRVAVAPPSSWLREARTP